MSKAEKLLDPLKEAAAVKSLRASLEAAGAGDDEEFLMDAIEGETSLFEIIDKLLLRRTESLGLAVGLSGVIDDLGARKRRFEAAAERDKTLVEQALAVAELDALVRPSATLSMTRRAPSVVITEESAIPSKYWKTPPPTLDKAALSQAVKAHKAALAIEDPEEREEALAAAPEVPGATLNNAAPSLTIRTK
ncbi:siphovirus Gp157 family protein [Phenylobacterium sp.]|uniref:siphovirus Gp157 family protein n=1 Tax=Phenylobacterium sp. TaxID=1871053 RepID=UPI002737A619|nr:siphovirus Gp157 family protein [Phenylobacterium sp.]MDP3869138.1 siphovirus Gp157 family protein [Phenylobacterium sp.]